MSFIKGFIPSFILSFLAFATIILYGGSFALSLIEEKENGLIENGDNEIVDGPGDGVSINTTQNTFSFALIITDEPATEEDDEESEEDAEEDTEAPDTENPDTENPDTENPDTENPDTGIVFPDMENAPNFVKEFAQIIEEDKINLEFEVKFICVVSINATTSKSFITVIPGDSIASIGGVGMPLSYALYFAENTSLDLKNYIPSMVVATTGVIPDFCGYVDIDDFVKLADLLDDLKYQNDLRITTELKRNDKKITVPVGNIDLSSDRLSALLEYEDYADKYRPSQILVDVSRIMLDSICKQFKPNIVSKVRSMLKYVETDFTANDMSRLSSIFFSYETSEKSAVPMLGAYESDLFFHINSNGSVKKFKEYLN